MTAYDKMLSSWEMASPRLSVHQTSIRLTTTNKERIDLIHSRFPNRSVSQIINDLLCCSLDQIQEVL